MYCREWAVKQLKNILDLLHDGKDCNKETSRAIDDFMEHYDYEQLNLSKEELPKDRLMELIRFFQISGVCEYDLFETPDILYETFADNLPAETYEKLNKNRMSGKLVEECAL